MKRFESTGGDMGLMSRFQDEVIRINDIGDIYCVLSDMIDLLVKSLAEKLDSAYSLRLSRCSESDYQCLEKLVQKHEAEIRNHIRTEQQLRLYIENLESENETKVASTEKEMAKLKSEIKILNEKMSKSVKEFSFLRPGSKEKIYKEAIEDVKLSTRGTMVVLDLNQRSYLENLKKGKPASSTLHQKTELTRLNANRKTHQEDIQDQMNTNSFTMKRIKHYAHHSISNPQGLLEELKHKTGSNFTSSFQRLLNTYKKSRESHKSVSYEGGAQSEALLRGVPKADIPYKPKLTSRLQNGKNKLFDRKLTKTQRVYNSKRIEP
jgi:hypothetical protein